MSEKEVAFIFYFKRTLLSDSTFSVLLAVEKIKHQMAKGGIFEKENETVHRARKFFRIFQKKLLI
jgi:hypothetical protein